MPYDNIHQLSFSMLLFKKQYNPKTHIKIDGDQKKKM